MKIGVYVGSFNPVHKGHKKVIHYLLSNNYIDKVEVIPTTNYWEKDNLIDINKRIDMLKVYETNKIIVNDSLNNIPYTYLLLRELKKQYNDDELYLIIGADNIVKFNLWKEYNEIINNYKIIILPRDGINIYKYIEKYVNKDSFIIVDNFGEYDISASRIRELILDKQYNLLSNYLDVKVIDYIKQYDLYS